jgi:hypothetical protein
MGEPIQQDSETTRRSLLAMSTGAPVLALGGSAVAQATAGRTPAVPPPPAPHDGQTDFDFVIGDWRAHVRRMPDRLNGSTTWIEYEGTSSHQKLFGGPANLEEFKVESLDGKLEIHAQTLRLYNAESRQWSIYLVDAAKGTLGLPPVVGDFRAGRGVFYDQELFKGRAIFVRYQWFDLSPLACRMEQSFSADGGQSWETNWICALSRDRASS